MPGEESLTQRKYYAHSRNGFWPIMHTLFNVGSADIDYKIRTENIQKRNIALWDVIESCERKGSLDSEIVPESICLNDFNSLLGAYPKIKVIFFNGKKAHNLFVKHVFCGLKRKDLVFHQLPSTSPAYALLSIKDKVSQWSIIKKYL